MDRTALALRGLEPRVLAAPSGADLLPIAAGVAAGLDPATIADIARRAEMILARRESGLTVRAGLAEAGSCVLAALAAGKSRGAFDFTTEIGDDSGWFRSRHTTAWVRTRGSFWTE